MRVTSVISHVFTTYSDLLVYSTNNSPGEQTGQRANRPGVTVGPQRDRLEQLVRILLTTLNYKTLRKEGK